MRHINIGGYSLVELLIALALGSVVTAGMVQLFIANSETYHLLLGQSRMQESARIALDFISKEARQAGYKGCYSSTEDFYSTIQPESDIPYEFDMRFGIQGFESTGMGLWSPSLGLLPNTDTDFVLSNPLNSVFKTSYGYGSGSGIKIKKITSGTDVVTFRHLSQTEARLGGYNNGGGTLYGAMLNSTEQPVIGIGIGWDEFDMDHLVMIHDCEKSTLFRVTSANPWGRNTNKSPRSVAGARDLTIGHDLANTDATHNSFMKLARINTFGTDARVSAIQSRTFFIAPGVGLNNEGNTPLSLWRKSGLTRPVELVEGVEDLQILYGIDTNADLIPNQYVQAHRVVHWTRVITIKISIVVNSINSVGSTLTPTHGCNVQSCARGQTWDGLLRKSFSQTVQLRNHGF